MVRLKKGLASRYWEEVVNLLLCEFKKLMRGYLQLLAIIGEQYDVGNEICGAVLSIRFQEDIISIWNRNAGACSVDFGFNLMLTWYVVENHEATMKIR